MRGSTGLSRDLWGSRLCLAGGLALLAGCTFKGERNDGAGGGGGVATGLGGHIGTGGTGVRIDSGTFYGDAYTGPCRNLECRQTTCTQGACVAPPCAAGGKTTVSGVVNDPAGKVPLYNVVVYVPNAALDPVPEGASCDRCGATLSGKPIASALTDESGHFVLENVPVGADVPLVVQVGKWRRELTVPSVAACTDTPITDPNLIRLPRNRTEGHIPKIALTTGNADALECLLRKIGLEDGEFTPEGGAGRVNLFAGVGGTNRYNTPLNGGAAFTGVEPWWNSVANLMTYDILLHSCEGTENPTNKSLAARQAFLQYTAAGGRVFLSHWHNYWLEQGPAPLPMTATFDHQDDLPSPFTATLDTSFPKGQAMANWLVNVGGSTTPGQLVILAGQHTVDTANPTYSQRWIYSDAVPGSGTRTLRNPSVQYFTFNTPADAPAEQQCGRVVLSDIHVSNAGTPNDRSAGNLPFPTGCQAVNLSPQEKALEFMLFDLSSCIIPDSGVPIPPVIIP
jgi:hypothetical protein